MQDNMPLHERLPKGSLPYVRRVEGYDITYELPGNFNSKVPLFEKVAMLLGKYIIHTKALPFEHPYSESFLQGAYIREDGKLVILGEVKRELIGKNYPPCEDGKDDIYKNEFQVTVCSNDQSLTNEIGDKVRALWLQWGRTNRPKV